MSELEASTDDHKALAIQREIQVTRAEVVADIDRLRDAVRERISIRHIMQTHPRATKAVAIGLGITGALALTMIWRSAKASRRNGTEGALRTRGLSPRRAG